MSLQLPKGAFTHPFAASQALNPPGGDVCASFAAQVEDGFATGKAFAPMLADIIGDAWRITPEVFRDTMIRNLDEAMARKRCKKDFDPAKLPYALQRYSDERVKMATGEKQLHPVVPSAATIENWMEGDSRPDGTQTALMAQAFGLDLRQEHMLWKSLQGKNLGMMALVQSIRKGNCGAMCAQLVRASGFTNERLAEVVGISQPTLSAWMDARSEQKTDNVEAVRRFEKVMTQCLDIKEAELKPWQIGWLQRDIANLMVGRDLEKKPSNPKDAAARFQMLLDTAFSEGKGFDQFLTELVAEWQVPPSYLNFINDNNVKYGLKAADGSAYVPIDTGSIYRWKKGEESPRSDVVMKIISGTMLGQEQEFKLWKMINGTPLSAEDVKADISTGNSAKVLNRLMAASGIGHDRLLELSAAHTGNMFRWRDEKNPHHIRDVAQARLLADMLLRHVTWGEQPPAQAEMEALRESVVASLTGRALDKSLHEMTQEAAAHDKPHGRMMQLLAGRLGLDNEGTAAALELKSVKVLSDLKGGLRSCTEAEALRMIECCCGKADDDAVRDAVNVLTQTRSPSEMLALAQQGEVWIGKVSEAARKRRNLRRVDLQKPCGMKGPEIEAWEEGTERLYVDAGKAQNLADFIGFEGEERRCYLRLATGQKLVPIETIIAGAERITYSDGDTLKRLVEQATIPLGEVADKIGVGEDFLKGICSGATPAFGFPEGSIRKLGKLCGVPKDRDLRKRLEDIFNPGAQRIIRLVEAGAISHATGLERLLVLGATTAEGLGFPDMDMKDIFSDARLPQLVKAVGQRLHLPPASIKNAGRLLARCWAGHCSIMRGAARWRPIRSRS